jgi:hypothetical protein
MSNGRGGARHDESILGTADLRSLADLGNSPMLPLLLFAYPLDELIIGSVRSLIGA